MFEVGKSHLKPLNQKMTKLGGTEWPENVKDTTIDALNTRMQLMFTHSEIVSIYHS